jgi:hypothetical protein
VPELLAVVRGVDSDDYGALPEDVEVWCVYCGRHSEQSEFITAQ